MTDSNIKAQHKKQIARLDSSISLALGALLVAAPALGFANSKSINNSPEINTLNNPWFIQSSIAVSADTDFHNSIIGLDFEQAREYSSLASLTIGKQISDTLFKWPLELYFYSSTQYFSERGFQPDFWGMTSYFKAYKTFTIPLAKLPVRVGFGHGLSYVNSIPVAEAREFDPAQSERLLYYMDYSLQLPVNDLLGRAPGNFSKDVGDVYLGYTIWHRSSVFGLLADTANGINYLGAGLELSLK